MKITDVSMNTNPQQATAKKEAAEAANFESAIEKAIASGDKEQLKKVSEQFESVFIHMMIKSMRTTVTDGGLTEKSHARGIYEGMYDQEMANKMASGRTMGVANMLYKQLEKYVDGDTDKKDEAEVKKMSLDVKG